MHAAAHIINSLRVENEEGLCAYMHIAPLHSQPLIFLAVTLSLLTEKPYSKPLGHDVVYIPITTLTHGTSMTSK